MSTLIQPAHCAGNASASDKVPSSHSSPDRRRLRDTSIDCHDRGARTTIASWSRRIDRGTAARPRAEHVRWRVNALSDWCHTSFEPTSVRRRAAGHYHRRYPDSGKPSRVDRRAKAVRWRPSPRSKGGPTRATLCPSRPQVCWTSQTSFFLLRAPLCVGSTLIENVLLNSRDVTRISIF